MAKSSKEEVKSKKLKAESGTARIVYPEYVSLKDWAGALMIDYPEVFLPILDDESKWQDWGAAVSGSSVFREARVPSPFTMNEGSRKQDFKSWQDWAKAVYICMHGIKY